MICPVCNQNIPDGSNYCPACAADLTKYRRQIAAANQTRQNAGPSPQQPPQQGYYQEPSRAPGPQGYPNQSAQGYQGHPNYQDQSAYPSQGAGEGGLFEGISPRGKLFFGVGGLVLLVVLVLLIANLLSGGGGDDPNNPSNPNNGLVIATAIPTPTEVPPDNGNFGADIWGNSNNPEGNVGGTQGTIQEPTSVPAPTAIPTFTLLKKGMTGEDVKRLQERLILLNMLEGPADGEYGPATVDAVRKFQKSVGLQTDGAAGQETQQKLYGVPVGGDSSGGTTGDTPQQNEVPISQPG